MLTLKEHKFSNSTVISLLLQLFVTLPAGGAVSHYCFDGLEPPVTLHFDNFNGHHDDHGSDHNDSEKQLLSDNLLSKDFDFDSSLFVAVALPVVLLQQSEQQKADFHTSSQASKSPRHLHPPLRAPPHTA